MNNINGLTKLNRSLVHEENADYWSKITQELCYKYLRKSKSRINIVTFKDRHNTVTGM